MDQDRYNELLILLEKRWMEFNFIYNEYENHPGIPKEIVDKFNNEIKPFSKEWSRNDTLITEIMDIHIRTYWQNKIVNKQKDITDSVLSYFKKATVVLVFCFFAFLIFFLSIYIKSNEYDKIEFYSDLQSGKWCDSVKMVDDDLICTVGVHKYILKR